MSIMAAALLILASGTNGADVSQPATAKPAGTAESSDPNDPIVCQSDREIGSRIKRKRICMKRSEWQRQHQEEKGMIDRTQVLRGMNPAG